MDINVQDPWFSHIAAKRKSIEGRLNKGTFAGLTKGQALNIKGPDGRTVRAVVRRIRRYDSFAAYLSQEGLRKTLPGVATIDEGVAVYRRFYTEEAERQHGVLAIRLKVLDA